MRRWCLGLASLVVSAAFALPPPETVFVHGLRAPAEILVDRWGVPHLYAGNTDDLYFTQGWNAARDRLFQIDLWRRRGLGRLAEVFGKTYVEDDRAARLLMYRGDMNAEWAAYGRGARNVAARFTAGINAYVDWLALHPEKLPPEFRLQHYAPAHWTPDDLIRIRAHGLSRNVESEVARAQGACRGDLALDRVRSPLSPPWSASVPDGLDPCVPRDVLRLYNLATREFKLSAEGPIAKQIDSPPLPDEQYDGSNNWAIAPSRSATGRPILANDPHRAYTEPSVRYLVGLEAPGLHVVGANEPQIPGISLGHNETIAFGYTIFPADQEDLYVYELDADLARYRYRKGWESLRTLEESITVRDAPAQTVKLQFTRHGPILFVDAAKHRAYALRSAWFEPGTSVYFGALSYLRARNLGEYERAIERWRAPTLNHLYADIRGTIAWLPAGFIPRRRNWDGLLPVPGDGRFEWDGTWNHSELPRRVNPPEGYLSTSNELNLPVGYPYTERRLGFEWTSPFRHLRIDQVLSSRSKISIEDSERLQNDVVSVAAQRILEQCRDLRADDPDAHAGLALLSHWDGTVAGDSAAAALYETWMTHHLRPAVRTLLLPPAQATGVDSASIDTTVNFSEHPAEWLTEHGTERRDALFVQTLGAAVRELRTRLGSDPGRWRWDALQYNVSEHPFSPILNAAERGRFDVGPYPKDGDGSVPNQSAFRAADFRQVGGPSVRVVMDVGRWDASVAINHPGQSGNPDDLHYRDLADSWRRGEYFPLLFTRNAVELQTERVYRLVPVR
jgi:penicillin G amidase